MRGNVISRISLRHLMVLTLSENLDGVLKARVPTTHGQVSISSLVMRGCYPTGQKREATAPGS